MALRDPESAWQPFSAYPGTGAGVLVSHGFTGGPASVIHLARRLAEAGFNVECPRLTGHGPAWRELAKATREDWLRDLRAALERLKARGGPVFVAGLSMGGTLALRLAETDPAIRGVALVNHALVFGHPLVPLAFLLKHLVPSTPGIASDILDSGISEPACDRTPTAGVEQVYRLAREARAALPSLRQPLLIFKSREDHVLPARNAPLTLQEAGSADKELVWLQHSYHVATMDHDKELIADRCIAFFTRLAREVP
ncbi:alpha/beta hydrolase [Mesoterricola silvestris]|uniref:Esterase n=1 Tax=Mesoterricola silvestris TaxID=2927979 RepID=A0AA48GKU7_9BACT|nr:alpha/beta fold hydrolase [Mesoterricola silvestris]BDU71290.1 esterase [Mesoterricola silvestris]